MASGKPQASTVRPRAAAINRLGLQLLERLGAGHPGSNLLLSPYSLSLALATFLSALYVIVDDVYQTHIPASEARLW